MPSPIERFKLVYNAFMGRDAFDEKTTQNGSKSQELLGGEMNGSFKVRKETGGD